MQLFQANCGGMTMEMHEIRPEISQALLTNPGIGFIAAPELMDAEPYALRDSRGQIVAPYKFTPDSRTWNHPDSGVLFCSCRWKDIEPLQGTYDWRCLVGIFSSRLSMR